MLPGGRVRRPQTRASGRSFVRDPKEFADVRFGAGTKEVTADAVDAANDAGVHSASTRAARTRGPDSAHLGLAP
jgi:hypothetical protein